MHFVISPNHILGWERNSYNMLTMIQTRASVDISEYILMIFCIYNIYTVLPGQVGISSMYLSILSAMDALPFYYAIMLIEIQFLYSQPERRFGGLCVLCLCPVCFFFFVHLLQTENIEGLYCNHT